MEFCYLVRRSVLDDSDLEAIDTAVADFHRDRVAFNEIRPDGYSLPRQHSLVHYRFLIQEFGAPNGLCSSITESKHIKAVKEPWRRSSRFEALGQMLVTNQQLDKLAAALVNFQSHPRGCLALRFLDNPTLNHPLPHNHQTTQTMMTTMEEPLTEMFWVKSLLRESHVRLLFILQEFQVGNCFFLFFYFFFNSS